MELSAEGKPLGQTQVDLSRGENPLRLHASLNTPGALDISVAIRAGALGEVHFDQAVDAAAAEGAVHLAGSRRAGFALPGHARQRAVRSEPRQRTGRRSHLNDYQLVIFNNWDLEAIPASGKQALEQYVQQGGGLLVIGGERNMYKEDKKVEDPLERALPAKLAPPRSPEGTAVVLIIDKSSSMEGRKMEVARLAAIGVVENLRPIDQVGVLIFDNSFEWAVPIRRVGDDKALIKRLISGITPDGGTQIAPALTEAYRKIRPITATYKHIVLLTDGISEEGDSLTLAKEAETQKITISTVGLGQDVNRNYLERVAAIAGGKSYFVLDFQALEQILLRDVLEHTGSTTVERPLPPEVLKHAEILNDVGMETRAGAQGLRAVHLQADRRDHPAARPPRSACWRAGSTGWDAPPCLLRMPRLAGRRTGYRGKATTSSGRISAAICFRAPRAAKRRSITTAPTATWWWSIAWAAASPSRTRFPTSTPSVPMDSSSRFR